jgi:acetyl-CoA carboxylase biotin carboxyl carrier protein
MDGKNNVPFPGGSKQSTGQEQPGDGRMAHAADVMSIEQLQRLVRLLDASDVSELEVKCAGEGTRLVLRKAKAAESTEQPLAAVSPALPAMPEAAPEAQKHKVVAPLVGTFHMGARPKGRALVAVGDHVEAGQPVGTIESLNMFNEVEIPVSGHVLEIFVQDGEPVEYGQVLMTIEIAEEK